MNKPASVRLSLQQCAERVLTSNTVDKPAELCAKVDGIDEQQAYNRACAIRARLKKKGLIYKKGRKYLLLKEWRAMV